MCSITVLAACWACTRTHTVSGGEPTSGSSESPPADDGVGEGDESAAHAAANEGNSGKTSTSESTSGGGATGSGKSSADGASASMANGSSAAGGATSSGADQCWQLPVVTRARVLAAPGQEAALVGGKIQGSATSAMNGFVDLATIATAPAAGAWVDLSFDNTTAYRYVKYFGPAGSYAVVAEVEFYAGADRLTGAGFGTSAAAAPGANGTASSGSASSDAASSEAATSSAPSASADAAGHPFSNALDGDPSTYYQSSIANSSYVGIDAGSDHVTAAPSISPAGGSFTSTPTVTLSAAAGAKLLYTLDGSDPATHGTAYSAPFSVPSGATLLRAVAEQDCMLPSDVSKATFQVTDPNAPPPVAVAPPNLPPVPTITASSMHIGNSLTDMIVDDLEPLAATGGVVLDFNRYTIPGAGTWLYDTNPTGGFGVDNVQTSLRTRPFDHLSVQPYPNEPCQIVPSTGTADSGPDSDSGYIMDAWSDALTQNPKVQLWLYQQWPDPLDYTNCITGGGWLRSDDWQPPDPTSWESASMNELAYDEKLMTVLIGLNPNAPPPYIVPGGLGLVNLKHAIEAGNVPGFTNFFQQIFLSQGTDVHLTPPGQYFISLLFYATMFERNTAYTANDPSYLLTDEQADVFKTIAWDTVTNYAHSGVNRSAQP